MYSEEKNIHLFSHIYIQPELHQDNFNKNKKIKKIYLSYTPKARRVFAVDMQIQPLSCQ